jgi:Peptidase A4 family
LPSKAAAVSMLVVALLTLSATAGVAFAAPPTAAGKQASPLLSKVDCTDCLAGYGINGSAKGTVTGAYVMITVPTVSCATKNNNYASQQVAMIDGLPGLDYAYAGAEEYCQNGSVLYYSVYDNSYDASTGFASISPGDVLNVSVTESAGTFTFKVTDLTDSRGSISGTGAATFAYLEYASCANTFYSNGEGQVDFGTVFFSGCSATVSGSTASIGKGPSLTKFVCVGMTGKPLDNTGKLSKKTGNFAVTYKKPGP